MSTIRLTLDEVDALLLSGAFPDFRAMPDASGIYAVFEQEPGAMPLAPRHARHLVYIGITTDSLKTRCALFHKTSGRSSLRRSVGAILLASGIALRPQPRGSGKSQKDFTSYAFHPDDETYLTNWMRTNLRYRWVTMGDKAALKEMERHLINHHQPPLNIDHATHDFVARLEDLRACCVAAATTTKKSG